MIALILLLVNNNRLKLCNRPMTLKCVLMKGICNARVMLNTMHLGLLRLIVKVLSEFFFYLDQIS